MKEYVIWGKENEKAEHECLLVSEHAGLKSMEQAVKTIEKLKDLGCVDMRVQVIDFSDPGAINRLFAESVNI